MAESPIFAPNDERQGVSLIRSGARYSGNNIEGLSRIIFTPTSKTPITMQGDSEVVVVGQPKFDSNYSLDSTQVPSISTLDLRNKQNTDAGNLFKNMYKYKLGWIDSSVSPIVTVPSINGKAWGQSIALDIADRSVNLHISLSNLASVSSGSILMNYLRGLSVLNRGLLAPTYKKIFEYAEQVLGSPAIAERWLEAPSVALNQRRPVDLIGSPAEEHLIFELLGRIEYGVYT